MLMRVPFSLLLVLSMLLTGHQQQASAQQQVPQPQPPPPATLDNVTDLQQADQMMDFIAGIRTSSRHETWTADNPLSNWSGVTYTASVGYTVRWSFRKGTPRLEGGFDAAKFPSLVSSFSASSNHVGGHFNFEKFAVPNVLKFLSIYANDFFGSFDMGTLVQRLPQLAYLHIGNNSFSGNLDLTKLTPTWTHLHLQYNSFEKGDFSDFSNAPNLIVLTCPHNFISAQIWADRFPRKLVYLGLYNNSFFGDFRFEDVPTALTSSLSVSHNKLTGVSPDFSVLANSKITAIGINYNKFNGTLDLTNLPVNITYFTANRNEFTSLILPPLSEGGLAKHNRLIVLYVNDNKIVAPVLSLHRDHLPPLIQNLRIYSNKFYGTPNLDNLPSTLLDFLAYNNQLNGTIDLRASLWPPQFRYLHINNNKGITGTVDLRQTPKTMTHIFVANCNFTAITVPDMSTTHPRLRSLSIGANPYATGALGNFCKRAPPSTTYLHVGYLPKMTGTLRVQDCPRGLYYMYFHDSGFSGTFDMQYIVDSMPQVRYIYLRGNYYLPDSAPYVDFTRVPNKLTQFGLNNMKGFDGDDYVAEISSAVCARTYPVGTNGAEVTTVSKTVTWSSSQYAGVVALLVEDERSQKVCEPVVSAQTVLPPPSFTNRTAGGVGYYLNVKCVFDRWDHATQLVEVDCRQGDGASGYNKTFETPVWAGVVQTISDTSVQIPCGGFEGGKLVHHTLASFFGLNVSMTYALRPTNESSQSGGERAAAVAYIRLNQVQRNVTAGVEYLRCGTLTEVPTETLEITPSRSISRSTSRTKSVDYPTPAPDMIAAAAQDDDGEDSHGVAKMWGGIGAALLLIALVALAAVAKRRRAGGATAAARSSGNFRLMDPKHNNTDFFGVELTIDELKNVSNREHAVEGTNTAKATTTAMMMEEPLLAGSMETHGAAANEMGLSEEIAAAVGGGPPRVAATLAGSGASNALDNRVDSDDDLLPSVRTATSHPPLVPATAAIVVVPPVQKPSVNDFIDPTFDNDI